MADEQMEMPVPGNAERSRLAPAPATDPWSKHLSDLDRQVLEQSGYGQGRELIGPMAVLVIDMTYDFLGDRPEPILDSTKRFPNSTGEQGWEAANRLAPVLAAARTAAVPVIYTARTLDHPLLEELSWGTKQINAGRPVNAAGENTHFPPCLIPEPRDIVIHKTKPSGFFSTPLREYLISLGIRQVLISGATTSGCVRATVIDAFSYGFRVAVLRDCVADRITASHAINLFDMKAKYADLITAGEAINHLERSVER
jgi:maleamate amidohydrolase